MFDTPTDDELEQVRQFTGTPEQLIELVRELWSPEDFVTITKIPESKAVAVRFVTGGWSGNEEIIGTLKRTFLRMFWRSSTSGGAHEFHVPAAMWEAPLDIRFPAPKCPHCHREI
ncbi:hypothetical protein ACFVAJ_17795 [Agromyces sp. NPDC057679]|uniref:hypothetical protein n=1 Tax=Agromyces sp. NPDC057679 TaxID=3346207 RepID=UPI00366D6F66